MRRCPPCRTAMAAAARSQALALRRRRHVRGGHNEADRGMEATSKRRCRQDVRSEPRMDRRVSGLRVAAIAKVTRIQLRTHLQMVRCCARSGPHMQRIATPRAAAPVEMQSRSGRAQPGPPRPSSWPHATGPGPLHRHSRSSLAAHERSNHRYSTASPLRPRSLSSRSSRPIQNAAGNSATSGTLKHQSLTSAAHLTASFSVISTGNSLPNDRSAAR